MLTGTDALWWLSGGCALDVFLGRATRPHGDIDVSVRRSDWPTLRRHLSDRLDIVIARDSRLHPLPESNGPLDDSVHNLWARVPDGDAWRLQINPEACVGTHWVFRRDPRIRRPMTDVVWHRDDGLPFVNPSVQLLWKARDPQPKDETDLANVEPHLVAAEREWLKNAITLAHPDSPWRERL
ncbi:MAG TPA: amino acid transporter [Acidimicrobiia bacterium]|nr:amino acid transporter [Acidimicrobiia bacterium]